MREGTLAVLVFVISTHFVRTTAGLVEFSRSFVDHDLLKGIQGVSLAKCREHCENRIRCKSTVYYRTTAYCVLTSTSREVQVTHSTIGAVLLSDIRPPDQTHIDCDGTACASNQACVGGTPGARVCEVKECTPLPSFYEAVSGNLNGVGNRLFVRGAPSSMTVECDQGGFWIPQGLHVSIDCTDVFGYSGVYTMTSTSQQVYCDMDTDEGHWLVFQRRQDGSENFQRQWIDYRNGFGALNGEFWLGLEAIHGILSNGEYELRVDLEDFSGDKRFAKYRVFGIASEADFYTLLASGFSGNTGDSLSGHSGQKFSTTDMDNDICSCNCASLYYGAWWYSKCHSSNLNGLYFHGGQNTTLYARHVHWSQYRGYWHSLKVTEMKFRRKWTA